MKTMHALRKTAAGVQLTEVHIPQCENEHDVIIKVKKAALCRTDLYVAEDLIATKDNLTLGHEFSGCVHEKGTAVKNFEIGEAVTIMPIIPCENCSYCDSKQYSICPHSKMLGVELQGTFAEYVRVPERAVYKLPDTLSYSEGAYVEPLTAALAIVSSGIRPQERGVLLGTHRIAVLAKRVLDAYGFQNVDHLEDLEELKESNFRDYDFAIETKADTFQINSLLKALRPRGRFLVKSRSFQSTAIDLTLVAKKELMLSGIHYGSFSQALELLSSKTICVNDLIGDEYSLSQHEEAFERAAKSELTKVYFSLENL